MNDDFLYRLRTEPPEHFASQLKDRLDRGSKRSARVWRFGLGVLLFGTAFAFVAQSPRFNSVIDWFRGEPPTAAADVPTETPRGLARAFGDRKVEAPDTGGANVAATPNPTEEQVRQGALALLQEEQARRLVPSTLVTPERASGSDSTETRSEDRGVSADPIIDAQRDFIVTGPLLGEVGTPAYMFKARRSFFTLMAWTLESLEDTARHAPLNQKAAQTATYRLTTLTSMMPDFFSRDERGSDVPTRSADAVWARKNEFMAQCYQFSVAMRGLLQAVKSDDDQQLRDKIAAVRSECTSCHEKFRKGGDKDVGAVMP